VRRCVAANLRSSSRRGQADVFRSAPIFGLGLHLGMSGELRVEPVNYARGNTTTSSCPPHGNAGLHRPAHVGGVEFHRRRRRPSGGRASLRPSLSPAFTADAVAAFLQRRARAPIQAVLLMQERFPGIGNWMADEVLWRAAIHPGAPPVRCGLPRCGRSGAKCRRVCRLALATIAGRG